MQLGVIGLGTMGANIARNAASRGAAVSVYNRTTSKMDAFIKEYGSKGDFSGHASYKEFIDSLSPPRAILIMVNAGPAVDSVIEEILPLLSPGDVLIDGGNSFYRDSERREKSVTEKGIHFIGMGISGGEEGALEGPSMMPGGSAEGYKIIEPLFKQMAADDGEGGKCFTYVGPGGAGHFVKTVHNGIEYGLMQLIAEVYHSLKNIGKFDNEQLAETFTLWNQSEELQSFLVEITAEIFKQKDDLIKEGNLIDAIKDTAKQKGTGRWTTESALQYGVAIPTVTAAVDARIVSGAENLRQSGQRMPFSLDDHDTLPKPEQLRFFARNSLELSSIITYAQGMELIKQASTDEQWNINLSEVARIWRGGCIIRSNYLKKLQRIYDVNHPEYAKGATEATMERFTGERQRNWRQFIQFAIARGIPVPALSASIAYFDSLRQTTLPQNLIQAQRDYFGAHTYQRTDKEGVFHTNWTV